MQGSIIAVGDQPAQANTTRKVAGLGANGCPRRGRNTGLRPKVRARPSRDDDAGSARLLNKVLLELCECSREGSGTWVG